MHFGKIEKNMKKCESGSTARVASDLDHIDLG